MEQKTEIQKYIREKYSEEIEKRLNKKVRNVFFLTSSWDGKDYFVFQTNNGVLLSILMVKNLLTSYESHRFI